MASVSRSNLLTPPISLREWQSTLIRLQAALPNLSPEESLRAWESIREMELAQYLTPLSFWTPNGKQEEAIREIGNLENFAVLLSFANGVGKTSSVFAILAALMWGAPSSAFDYPLYRQYPGRWPKIIRIVTEPALLNDGGPIQVESDKWWPKGRYTWSKGGKQFNRFFYTDTGFFGEVMSYEQAVKEFEGKTVAVNVFIEPPPEPIFNACIARQRMGGVNILDMTPLMGAAWVLDKLVSQPVMIVDGKEVGRVKTITASIEANCKIHGKNGQLEHSNIVQIVSRYDPDERAARAFGRFMALSGVVFKGFSRDAHVAKDEFEPPTDQPISIGMACDPAIAKPLSMLWRYVDAAGVLHYYDEYPETVFEGAKDSNLTVTDYVSIIKAKEQGRPIQSRILDRHFGTARRTLGGKSLKEEFSDAGLDMSDSYSMDEEIETGILRIKEMLRWDKTKPQDALNRPRIRISPKCRNLIAALERWGRDPKNGKPLEAYKDFIDVLRYDVMSNPEVEVAREWTSGNKPYYGVGNV